jgi:hypothetical protein
LVKSPAAAAAARARHTTAEAVVISTPTIETGCRRSELRRDTGSGYFRLCR